MQNNSPVGSIHTVVLDFDGVFVLDSDAVYKKEAWEEVFGHYGEQYKALLKEGNAMYGSGKPGGRREIMAYMFESLDEPKEKIPALVEEAARVFGEHVQKRILKAGLVPGMREVLEKLAARNVAMYLNSGTATQDLMQSARNLNIDQFFNGVLGSTPEPVGGSKVENLQYAAKQEGAGPVTMLMVGDGDSDWKAAREFGCHFLGVANVHNRWANEQKPFPLVADLRDILKYV